MTQRHKSAHKNFYYGGMSKRFASRLPAQSLCLLSSFSLLGSGFVVAQSETSSIDNIVPTIENSQPTAVKNPVQKEIVIPETVKSQPDFSERQVRLKKRLNNKNVSEAREVVKDSKSKVENNQLPASVRITKPKVKNTQPTASVRITKPKVENTQPTASVRITKPKVENTQPTASVNEADSVIKKLPEVAQPVNNSQNTAKKTGNNTKDYNNAYIDPTDYKNTATGNYEPPSSVIVTERSSGCQATVAAGQSAGSGCAKATQTPSVAKSKESSPTWLKKSETAKLSPVSPQRKLNAPTITANRNQDNSVAGAVARSVSKVSQNNWQVSKANTNSHTKAAYNANRFVPSPREFSTTTVSATPIAPQVGSLPAPMIEGNFAPRPSMVSYDFSLASVLPQVPYTNTLAYRGGGSGMVFPLAAAAPITSLFGWRIHPITGDRRFHAGTDIGAPTGTPILAASKGQVETANWLGGYGLTVIINHSSAQQSLYGHMSEILVQPGQWVEPGTVIGRVGSTGNSTGPHLHFEVRHLTQNGWVAVDPGVQLQGGLSQLVQTTQDRRTAQAQ
ncbi:M23 family metallopeptidase [Anabaena sp. UHCC 0253]|uniref:M23 family metallopeptidase n=1 Tax=Anabaena sp. UHCC 0253 TaxID=2590019 RepID=UPI0014452B66|nr:M23 family metallopeptidase [Anabaena sp. UHCC 0253]MTJ52299.1 M23 family metallopeptidase [Anabaena sp. UHCC 0253]